MLTEEIIVRKRDTDGEANVLANDIALRPADYPGVLGPARHHDRGTDDLEMDASARTDAPKEKPK